MREDVRDQFTKDNKIVAGIVWSMSCGFGNPCEGDWHALGSGQVDQQPSASCSELGGLSIEVGEGLCLTSDHSNIGRPRLLSNRGRSLAL